MNKFEKVLLLYLFLFFFLIFFLRQSFVNWNENEFIDFSVTFSCKSWNNFFFYFGFQWQTKNKKMEEKTTLNIT